MCASVCVCVYVVAWEEVGGVIGDDGNILNLSSIWVTQLASVGKKQLSYIWILSKMY